MLYLLIENLPVVLLSLTLLLLLTVISFLPQDSLLDYLIWIVKLCWVGFWHHAYIQRSLLSKCLILIPIYRSSSDVVDTNGLMHLSQFAQFL